MNSKQAHRGKRISLQQEKRAAAKLGGRTTAASGAAKFSGGADVRVMGKIRLECKFTEKAEYTLRYVELQKVRKQAMKALEQPVLQFAFRHPNGRLKAFAVTPWNTEEQPADNDHFWNTSANSVIFTEDQLQAALLTGRIQFLFSGGPLTDPPQFRMFEIMNWHDYVEVTTLKYSEAHEDARDQHNRSVPSTPDAAKGRDPESDTSQGPPR
jgi:hypothetical protein